MQKKKNINKGVNSTILIYVYNFFFFKKTEKMVSSPEPKRAGPRPRRCPTPENKWAGHVIWSNTNPKFLGQSWKP